jgi:hypothetical protein
MPNVTASFDEPQLGFFVNLDRCTRDECKTLNLCCIFHGQSRSMANVLPKQFRLRSMVLQIGSSRSNLGPSKL